MQPGQVGIALKTPGRETVGNYSRRPCSVSNSLTSTGSFSVDLGNGKGSPPAMLLLFEPAQNQSLKKMVLDLEKENQVLCPYSFHRCVAGAGR